MKKTEEFCRNEIFKAIPIVEKIYNTSLDFLGFSDHWNGSKNAKAVFRCKKHDCIFTTGYYAFIKISEILLNENIDLEFLGFLEESDLDKISKVDKLIIRCKKHNKIGHPTFERFINSGYHCEICTSERNSKEFRITDDLIIERLMNLHPGYKFFDLSAYNKSEDIYYRTVTAVCPNNHEPFRRTVQSFLKDTIHCPTCKLIEDSQKRIEKAKSLILERKQQFGIDIRFDGFINDKYLGYETNLLLHCNKCNTSWNTTKYSALISGRTICGCPVCSGTTKISISEELCNSSLRNILGEDIEIYRQFKIVPDQKKYRFNIFVDFYIPSKNLIVEYNGEQHYGHNVFFHKTKEAYENQLLRDRCLVEYCSSSGINLLIIPYTDLKRVDDILQIYLNDGIDSTTKLIPKL